MFSIVTNVGHLLLATIGLSTPTCDFNDPSRNCVGGFTISSAFDDVISISSIASLCIGSLS